MAKTATVIIPVTSNGLVIARENSIPCALYEIVSVDINIAGNAENIPPSTGPPVFAMKTASITINPPNTDRITRCFSGCPVFPEATDLIIKYFSSIHQAKNIIAP